jgi:redox-sensitive bicupin YhaK (pirin superfamily)
MPGAARVGVGPVFLHVPDPPTYAEQGATLRVLAGSLAGETSAAPTYSPLVAAEITLDPGAVATLPLERGFEHGVLVVRGELLAGSEIVGRDEMVYLGGGREALGLAAPDDAAGPTVLLLLGGEPFAEELVLWWNFLGRDHEEVLRHREDWNRAGEPGSPSRFGEVPGFEGERMHAPPMPNVRLRPWTPAP